MKSPMWFLKCVLEESGALCSTTTTMDFKVLSRRFEHEGMSLLTITLPNFCKSFEKWLEEGRASPLTRTGFKTRTGYSCPEIFSGMVGQVFDLESGVLHRDPSVQAIICIRQICLMFKRVHLECSDERKLAAISKYVQVEADLSNVEPLGSSGLDQAFALVSNYLWSQVLRKGYKSLCELDLPVKHGTGATADRIYGNRKYSSRYWYDRLQSAFPIDHFGFANANHMLDDDVGLENVRIIEESEEIPVRVIFVPKTLKTPSR